MPLFKVALTYEIAVSADNELQAVQYCVMNSNEFKYDFQDADDIHATAIKTVNDLPYGWDVECIPYNVPATYDNQIKNILK
jgi:hypothetical protein